jgi:hypothetical protein
LFTPIRVGNYKRKEALSFIVKKSPNKFNAQGQATMANLPFEGEAEYAMYLDWLVKAGEIKSWDQVKIDLKVNGVHITNYFVDFKVVTKNDTIQYHEYKGMVTIEWQMKWNLLHALINEIDPGAELIVIKHTSKYNPFKKSR